MNIKSLIKKELQFAKYEFQLKLKAKISEKGLQKLGAKRLGSTIHEDKFFIEKGKQINESNELIRIRTIGGEELMFTYKGPVANRRMRNRLIVDRSINEKEAAMIKRDHHEIVSVNKKRTYFILDKILISLDHVENMGDYIEFEVGKESDSDLVYNLIKKLGLDSANTTRLSYFELALMNFNTLQRIRSKLYEKFGKLSFGISSAVLTTLGIIVGLNSATESLRAVIGGIAAVAVSDSLSDSVGMYASKKAERGTSKNIALKSALNVFTGKIIFTLSFIIPFLFLSIVPAIYVAIVWGLILLSFVNIQIAFVQEEDTFKAVIKSLFIALVVIILSYAVGKLVAIIS